MIVYVFGVVFLVCLLLFMFIAFVSFYCMIFPPHRSRWVYGWLSFWRKKWKKVLHFDIHITYMKYFLSLLHTFHTHTHKRILLLYLHMNECSTVTTMTTTTTTSELLSQIYCSNNTSDERFDCNSWARNTHRDTRRPVWFAKSIKNCCALIVIRINSCIPHVKKRVRKISTYRFLFFGLKSKPIQQNFFSWN